MNDAQFQKICSLKNSDHTLLISFKENRMTGKLVDCWEDDFLVEAKGKYVLWPKDLCDSIKKDYPIPHYS